jgi:hypothetical protein
MKKFSVTFLMLVLSLQLFAQNGDPSISDSVYATGKIYVVVACIVLILLGLLFFLFTIERRLKKLEQKSAAKN